MSYILDALRRAESERERGAVPTINAQQLPVDAGEEERPGLRPWLWVAGALGLALLGALASRVLLHGEGEQRVAPPPPPVDQIKARPQPSLPVITPQVAAPAQIEPTQAQVVSTQAQVVPTQARPAMPLASPLATSVATPAVTSVAPAASATPSPPGTPASATLASAAQDRPVPTLKELPDEIRRELPPLVTGGSMYSDTPAARMIILNGQVFHEGDQVAPNLQLEQIKPRGAVLSFKGYRYSIGY